MYLMTCTRPDLAYPLSLLACYVAPGRHQKVHWDAVKRVLRYLRTASGIGLMLGRRGPVVLTGHATLCGLTTQLRSGHHRVTPSALVPALFLGGLHARLRFSTPVVRLRSAEIHSTTVVSSSCEAKIYAGAMAAQELRWLTYLLTDLGEQPRSPPVLYQRGQLRLAYMATRANTADIFTKALPPGDHQRFSTVLGLVPTLPHLLTA
ncbi:unnamed protein product [Closterium sp. NIES-53]